MTLNDRLLGIAALVFAAFLTWFGHDLEAPFAYEPVGPKAFPLLLALIIALCGIRLVLKGGNNVQANPPGANMRIILMAACLAAYAFFFQWMGFVIATALMAVVVGRLFGGSWGKVLIGGALMGLALFLLFDMGLDVVLPAGLLGDIL